MASMLHICGVLQCHGPMSAAVQSARRELAHHAPNVGNVERNACMSSKEKLSDDRRMIVSDELLREGNLNPSRIVDWK